MAKLLLVKPGHCFWRLFQSSTDLGIMGCQSPTSGSMGCLMLYIRRVVLPPYQLAFKECFSPIVDAISGRDFIPAMVYGRNVRGQEFGGMYCAVLTVNSYVVSVGMLRIFGKDIAELPLVATTNKDHGKGYFQTLFSCIERLLSFLNVKNLVLPAAEEAESIWTDKFGFSKMIPDQLISYRKNCHQMVTFKGTNMLHKTVPPCRIIHNQSWQSDI
ncbi:uncharacterized protein LOC107648256 isoform X2 [Arachis ipaensis]|uniref:uncharacterized protein LOC107648256 isoform X2 n=1 Tax=Arachis ipaensis TaxID=130454 RepID=UPI000A2B28C6|nr:uncharacterized protein LOC107648256 isoform X2 [Arachis ipaensis]